MEVGYTEWPQEEISGAVLGGFNGLILTSNTQFPTDWILLAAPLPGNETRRSVTSRTLISRCFAEE